VKKRIISLLLVITAFAVSTSQTYLSLSANTLLRANKPTKSTVKTDFQTESTCYFTSTNLFSLFKQNSENIRVIHSGSQTWCKTVYGFDKIFQLLCYARNNFRKFTINSKLFFNVFSYRQIDGYYLYHLCKMLH